MVCVSKLKLSAEKQSDVGVFWPNFKFKPEMSSLKLNMFFQLKIKFQVFTFQTKFRIKDKIMDLNFKLGKKSTVPFSKFCFEMVNYVSILKYFSS